MQAFDVQGPQTPARDTGDSDQRVFLHGLGWADYERLLEMRGESAGVRISYLEGEIELMSPSRSHERLKTMIARLLEAYAEEKNVTLNGFGSWTIKSEPDERGAEPDECYSLGPPGGAPDLAIEVVWTGGGIDKLEVYRKLGVREVWIWQRERMSVHALRDRRYEPVERSELLPALDLDHLLTFVDTEDQTAAVRRYRAAVRG